MAERPKSHEHAPSAIAVNRPDRLCDRERTIRMLKRIADILGRPVEDFYKANAGGGAGKTDSATGE